MLEVLLATAFGMVIIITMIRSHQLLMVNHVWFRERFFMMETAFTAEHFLQDALHGSRLTLCTYAAHRINLVKNSVSDYWDAPFEEARFVYSADSDKSRAVAKKTPHSDGRSAFSDVIIAPHPSLPAPVLEHETSGRFFDLASHAKVKTGELAVACHEDLAVLFQITAVSQEGSRIHYGHSTTVRPGNCAVLFDPLGGCEAHTSYRFPRGALLIPYRPQAIYLASQNKQSDHFSLFRKRLVVADFTEYKRAQMLREEWLQGINLLQVTALKSISNQDLALEIRLQLEDRLSAEVSASTDALPDNEQTATFALHTFTVIP